MVDSDPLILSNPGIAGKFYKINPHLVKVKGTTRGDFGIHFDANVPGTAGCIGIEDPQQWAGFQKINEALQPVWLNSNTVTGCLPLSPLPNQGISLKF